MGGERARSNGCFAHCEAFGEIAKSYVRCLGYLGSAKGFWHTCGLGRVAWAAPLRPPIGVSGGVEVALLRFPDPNPRPTPVTRPGRCKNALCEPTHESSEGAHRYVAVRKINKSPISRAWCLTPIR